MPSHARTAPFSQPPENSGTAALGRQPAAVPASRPPTPDEVVALVNNGTITLAAGSALTADLTPACLKGSRRATFSVPIAVRVAADTSPAAAMAHLDDTVTAGLHRMAWTSAHDTPDGHVIDPPHPPGRPAELAQSTLRAFAYLTVTVPAYPRYQFHRVARDLLDQDLQQLCHLGVQVGAARRRKNDDQTDAAWPAGDDHGHHGYHDYEGYGRYDGYNDDGHDYDFHDVGAKPSDEPRP